MGTLTKSHLSDILGKAATDAAFKQRLIEAPREVLAEHGIITQDLCRITVLEDTDSVIHMVIPWNTPVNHRLVEHRHFPNWVFASDHGHHKEIVGRVVESCWSNPEFRTRLMEAPGRVLGDYGLDIDGRRVVVRENSENDWYIVLPHE